MIVFVSCRTRNSKGASIFTAYKNIDCLEQTVPYDCIENNKIHWIKILKCTVIRSLSKIGGYRTDIWIKKRNRFLVKNRCSSGSNVLFSSEWLNGPCFLRHQCGRNMTPFVNMPELITL